MKETLPDNSDAIITRHSIRGNHAEYEGLSEAGIEQAKERAKDFVDIIEKSEPGTVFFFAGRSDEERTGSTMQIYVEEAEALLKDRKDVVFFDREKIAEEAKHGYSAAVAAIQNEANENAGAKVVIDSPLVMKDFNKKEWFFAPDGSTLPGWEALMAKHGKDHTAIIRDWFESQGVYNGEQQIPKPAEIAESYLNGVRRLQDFAGQFSGDRKVKVVAVGHSLHLDAFLTYLANDGVVDVAGFEKLGNEVVDTTEMSVIEPDQDGDLQLKYRGKEYKVGGEEGKE
ncbi:MAG: hypothetical protein WCG97_03450 [bacterium]